MIFDDVLNIKTKNYDVILGYNDNDVFKINLLDYPSIIITGSTGTSKSIMLNETLLQIIFKNPSNYLKILPIARTRVELKPYCKTNYCFTNDVISDIDEINEYLIKIKNIIDTRKKLFLKYEVKNFDSYNKINEENMLNFIIIAIDEANIIFENKYATDLLFYIIDNCIGMGISIVINTNSIYNDFFENNFNLNVSCKISFDVTSKEDADLINIKDAQKLLDKNFVVKYKNSLKQLNYKSIEFKDEYITKILKKDN